MYKVFPISSMLVQDSMEKKGNILQESCKNGWEPESTLPKVCDFCFTCLIFNKTLSLFDF